EAGDAFRVHLEGVAGAEICEAGEVGAAFGGVDVGQLTEEVLEACGRDDLDDLAGRVAGVPERVPLIARLEHPRAGAGSDDLVAEECAELSLEHVGVLVLLRMAMEGRGERARCERVMDDGEAPVCLGPFDLPDDAEPTELDAFTSVCRNRDSVELRAHGLSSVSVNIIVYRNGKLQPGCGGVNRSGASDGEEVRTEGTRRELQRDAGEDSRGDRRVARHA